MRQIILVAILENTTERGALIAVPDAFISLFSLGLLVYSHLFAFIIKRTVT